LCKLRTRRRFNTRFGLLKFFRTILVTTPDSELEELQNSYEKEIKQIKHQVYQLCWFMRGGVDSESLFYAADVEDLEILHSIVQENIESTKTTGMPLV